MTRVYVAATLAGLAGWHAAGAVPAGTDRVVAPADDEDSEYDALMTAAALAAGLGADDGRRVVVVAESAGGDEDAALPLSGWLAVHCDVTDRPADADPDDDLAWFGVQEIPDLI